MSALLKCLVNGTKIEMMIDSGSDVSTIDEKTWVDMLANHINGANELHKLKWGNGWRTLSAYAASEALSIEASFEARIEIPGAREINTTIFVIRGAKNSLLGREAAIALGVLRRGLNAVAHSTQSSESVLFPKIPGEKVHFDVDPEVLPTKNAFYSVPAAYRSENIV
jgi:hypothetical protein